MTGFTLEPATAIKSESLTAFTGISRMTGLGVVFDELSGEPAPLR